MFNKCLDDYNFFNIKWYMNFSKMNSYYNCEKKFINVRNRMNISWVIKYSIILKLFLMKFTDFHKTT